MIFITKHLSIVCVALNLTIILYMNQHYIYRDALFRSVIKGFCYWVALAMILVSVCVCVYRHWESSLVLLNNVNLICFQICPFLCKKNYDERIKR